MRNEDTYLSTKEIAKKIRSQVKEKYPTCKFSVATKSESINIALMEAPFEVFLPEHRKQKQYQQLNQYHLTEEYNDDLTPNALACMKAVNEIVKVYRYDNSDPMIDYFETNFYYDLDIGKWDKPFKVGIKDEKSLNFAAAIAGTAAFKAGKPRIPCQDKDLLSLLEGLQPGEGATKLLETWLENWDMANLA